MKKRYLDKTLRNILQTHLKDEADGYIEAIKSVSKKSDSWLVRLKDAEIDIWTEKGCSRNLIERLG